MTGDHDRGHWSTARKTYRAAEASAWAAPSPWLVSLGMGILRRASTPRCSRWRCSTAPPYSPWAAASFRCQPRSAPSPCPTGRSTPVRLASAQDSPPPATPAQPRAKTREPRASKWGPRGRGRGGAAAATRPAAGPGLLGVPAAARHSRRPPADLRVGRRRSACRCARS